ncbi:hypothetical protein OSB04_031414 [Centaurea solstitialis]|uniref:Retroviral polymerase SH3-like domain-containing protein n=1 Tax=Centaurea solstitialis TaxID=347529 RepID=A0AA38SMK9_9ASTR|nr:hypothetical protein OSB04_031414 [Centaurea solstitialis]
MMKMSRCMLSEEFLLALGINNSVYLLNRSLTKFHLKIFFSFCYLHVPSVMRSNLHESAEKGILVLVGYVVESKGYIIYNIWSKICDK